MQKKTHNSFWYKFGNLVLRDGATKDEYRMLKTTRMVDVNIQSLRVTGLFEGIFGIFNFIYYLFMNFNLVRVYLFLVLFVTGLFFAFFPYSKLKKYKAGFVLCFSYSISILAYLYGGFIALLPTLNVKEYPAITFMVLLVAIPLLFAEAFYLKEILTFTATVVFLTCSMKFSSPEIFSNNLLNAVSFFMVGSLLDIGISHQRMKQMREHLVRKKETEKSVEAQKAVIMGMANLIEGRDVATGEHVKRTEDLVSELTTELVRRKDDRVKDRRYVDYIREAAPLHDIGKIKVTDTILLKPGKLTPEEFELIKNHTTWGYEMIYDTLKGVQSEEFLKVAANIALDHHERWDGKGYPNHLKGEEIPLEARIMALADVYDALTSERPYKKAYPKEEAIQMILEGRGTQFDPELTDIFLEIVRKQPN